MSLEKVQQALIQAFSTTFAAWLPTQVAWENKKFTAPEALPWMFFHFIPVTERIATLGADGLDEVDGMVQIDVNYPFEIGEGSSRATINILRTCFKPGNLVYDGQGVSILSRSRAGGMTVDGFYKIPFTVRWRAFTPRNS